MAKVAYITSGKIGIHRFTYNELIELQKKQIQFVLCLTQLKPGPWIPQDNWKVIVTSKLKAIISFTILFFCRTGLWFSLVKDFLEYTNLPYFIVALSFYFDLRKESELTSIHCQMGDKKLYIGYYLKKILNLPLTVTVHAHELYQREVYENNSKVRMLYSSCDKVITISSFNKNILGKSIYEQTSNINMMRLFPIIDSQDKVKDKIKILIVANWAEKKGYDVLLQAIKNIEREDFVLWVVGGSYYSENSIDLNQLIEDYDISDKVELLGRQSGVVLDIIYYACDIFCLPSYTEYYADGKPAEREGIPVSLMEAMAWGKPVISTKHAGIPELVKEILVEERDVEGLKKAIENLLDHPEEWEDMGEKNQEIINNKYTKDNVNKLASIFNNFT